MTELTTTDAERITGLSCREMPTPADASKADPNLRYQLGVAMTERRQQREIPGVQRAFDDTVTLFLFVTFGATPAEAVTRWKRDHKP